MVALGVGAHGAEGAGTTNRPTLYYMPHTHWEGAVFKTREDYLTMGLPNILTAIRLLKEFPEYKFTLDQVAYFKPFLERYPEAAGDFRRFLAEGRLEIAGGMDVMPDDVKTGGEALIRQIQYGKRYCREQLGIDVKVAWLLDTFGHNAQLPQLLRGAGYTSFYAARGVPREETPMEFRWRGLDGTEIPTVWLPGSYGLFYWPPNKPAEFARFFRDRYATLDRYATGQERAGLAGVDVSEPEQHVVPLVRGFNQAADSPFTIRYSTPSEFASALARRPHLPLVTNELSPIFQGTYSSRIALRQTARQVENLLLTAEKLGAIGSWLGTPADDAMLWRAWEPTLFNQAHDIASGVMTDHVTEDTQYGFEFAKRLGTEMVESGLDRLVGAIDTRGGGTPIVIFNPLAWPRTDVVEVDLGIVEPGRRGVVLTDARGRTVPVQLEEVQRYRDGGLKQVRLVFVARDVPALGCATYRASPLPDAPASSQEAVPDPAATTLETEQLLVKIERETGAVVGLTDKVRGWEVLGGPANVVTRQRDKGDLWELYKGLDGGSHVAMTNRQAVPRAGDAAFSNEERGTNSVVRRGPVFSEFKVSHRFGPGQFATRVRIYQGLGRVHFHTDLVNGEKYVRYQALFPTSVRNGRSFQEIPFGALERPAGVEFPAQNWADLGDGKFGVALLNLGLPGNVMNEDTLMLSLLRSHNLGAYGYGGGYEPGMSSESGFEMGVERSFDYALFPHAGDWREAGIVRAGLEFNQPLVVRKSAPHPGALPPEWGLIDPLPAGVVLTALRPTADGAIAVRVYESEGRSARSVALGFGARVLEARESNLLEQPGRRLAAKGGRVLLDLRPFEIRTVLVRLATQKARAKNLP